MKNVYSADDLELAFLGVSQQTPPMKFSIGLPLRCCILLLAIILGLSHFEQRALAQPVVSAIQSDSDAMDARAYAVLFRRAAAYKRLAKAATSPDQPEAHLTSVLPGRLKLTGPDAQSLERIADSWAADTAPVQAQVAATVAKFHKSLQGGGAGLTVDRTPPALLGDLQKQENAITLRYRDLLRNAMRPDEFARINVQLRQLFGNNGLIAPASTVPISGASGVAQ